MSTYSNECLNASLSNNNIAIVEGVSSDDGSGHCWVVDGYINYLIRTYNRHTEPATITVKTTNYVHVNWGYDGQNNGYYLDNVFNFSKYHELDSSYHPSIGYTINYNYKIKYLIVKK